jgi:EXS family
VLSLFLFWAITRGSSRAVAAWEILPALYLLLLALCFALPYIRSRSGRYRFLSTLKRVSLGGLAEAKDGKFGDIILADVLTSYSKVLGDLFICICMFFSKGMSSTGTPNRTIGGSFMTPLIISIPSIIRLRQCLTEFIRVRKQRQASNGWGGQHLGNALKYASAFPVIALSALQRGYDPAKIHMSEAGLFRLWYERP